MIGYAYMDLDGNVVYKTASYIDNINPGFFSQNKHLIVKKWKFDTDDNPNMLKFFRELMDLHARKDVVRNFIRSIGYDMSKLKNANKIQ